MNRRGAISIVFLCAILVASGCGSGSGDSGSSDSSSASTPTKTSDLTKAQFIQKGDAICAAKEKEFLERRKGFIQLVSDHRMSIAQERQLISDYMVPSFRDQVHGLAKLGAPEGESDEVGAFLGEFEKAVAEGTADPAEMLGSSSGSLARAADLARSYGFEACLSRY